MEAIRQLLQNKVLIAALLAWLFAQVIKTIIQSLLTRKFQIERLWGAGGMPSAHSAMVCALTVSTARFYGCASPIFALTLIFAFVVVYDAMGVRRETGRHAKLLNRYLNEIEQEKADVDGDGVADRKIDTIDLKELIGHTPLEVLGGVILGVLVGMLFPIIPIEV
jgi:acid phosphatase family membrane protein YuiD